MQTCAMMAICVYFNVIVSMVITCLSVPFDFFFVLTTYCVNRLHTHNQALLFFSLSLSKITIAMRVLTI